MMTKLTLSMDEEIIRKAKQLAKEEQKSLSALVKELFEQRIEKQKKSRNIEDIQRLAGSFKIEEPTEFKDELDKARWEYLKKKHGL